MNSEENEAEPDGRSTSSVPSELSGKFQTCPSPRSTSTSTTVSIGEDVLFVPALNGCRLKEVN